MSIQKEFKKFNPKQVRFVFMHHKTKHGTNVYFKLDAVKQTCVKACVAEGKGKVSVKNNIGVYFITWNTFEQKYFNWMDTSNHEWSLKHITEQEFYVGYFEAIKILNEDCL